LNNDLLYQLALTEVPFIGCVQAKILVQHFGEAAAIFRAPQHMLEKIAGIGTVRAKSIRSFTDFETAEMEIKFVEKFGINTYFINDEKFPRRLLNCYDTPTLLFYKGTADLNYSKIVAVIGTRNHSEYARQVTEKLVKELSSSQVLLVSGLAYGIDGLAHRAAIKNDIPTVGVLGHGFRYIYPPEHTNLAKDMLKNGGGLLTEFWSDALPDKHHFPSRNRIVAGMSDAIVVIESGIKGGSMVTATLANGYNKDVFAIPGRITDHKSEGCLDLVKNNKAILLTDAQQLIDMMGWEEKKRTRKLQKEIFIELTADEQVIVTMLKEKDIMNIDDLNLRSGISNSAVAAAILNLELQGVISSQPGKIYRLV
jgi:DNA processing protein